jgi:hypothetical protein
MGAFLNYAENAAQEQEGGRDLQYQYAIKITKVRHKVIIWVL